MAESVEVRDEDGNLLQTKKYDGKYYVSHFIGNVKDHLAAIDDMAVRDDDTFIMSYPKSVTYGSWFDHIQAWDKTKKEYKGDNIMYLIYEDMKKDLRSHVGEIAPFLGANTETDFLDKVTDKCTFRNMVSEATKTFTPDDQWKEVTSTKTLPIYRKGEIGDWKNHFTVAQNEYFNKVYEEKMANNSFHFRFE
ncbi:Sulfotransferase 1C2A [Mizuhopecten yessoensis]|uniref:Sulfotransferase 1C2A n=1 Tax=Mizuhopecten yessoensis TaxID=6573 RepID=A0A210Q7I8_MIZYE|nr:Sulfotransferase 1C2A [Mizuhopecten yessoensis]